MFTLLIMWARMGFKAKGVTIADEQINEKQRNFEKMINTSAMCIRVLVNIQLASVSFFQVAFLKGIFNSYPRLSELLQAIGLHTNP